MELLKLLRDPECDPCPHFNVDCTEPVCNLYGDAADVIEAAVADLNRIAQTGKVWMCPFCAHAKKVYTHFVDCELTSCKPPFTEFKWRGVATDG